MEARFRSLGHPILFKWPIGASVRVLPLHGDGRRGKVVGHKPPHVVVVRLVSGWTFEFDERLLIRTGW